MQSDDPLPAQDTWWSSIVTAVCLVMARIGVWLVTGFAAYGAAMHPDPLWSLDEHVDGDDPLAGGADE